MPLAELTRVGRYEPILAIGTGGMATVYLARAALADGVAREVALKVVHPHLRDSEEAASTLIEEAKLAARIRHPNVVPVREVGRDDAGIFLVMDYVEGATLAELAKTGPLPLPIAARILADALAGLHAAHELASDDGRPLDLVHRDFSPQNVLVGADGVTRLTDFGIARAASRAGVTSAGVVKGKVGYLSPEQGLGKPLDRRSDVWAAGVVAWELLAARRLYTVEDDPMGMILRIVSETPPRLRTVRPELSALVDQAVATALTLDPARRWPNAEELARALAEGFRVHGGAAEREDVGELVRARVGEALSERRERYRSRVVPEAPPPRKRSRRALGLSLGAATLAAVAALSWAALRSREPVATEPARPPPPPAPIAPASSVVAAPEPEPTETHAPPPPRAARPRAAPKKRAPSLGPNPYRTP
jgi:serine/threonine-protein kinase